MTDALTLAEILWGDRPEPLFETARSFTLRRPLTKADAFAEIRSGARFIAPVPRVTRGSQKEDVAPTASILWVDIDRMDGREIIEDRFGPLDLRPTCTVFSGSQGFHAYWKLDTDLPVDRIERMNRDLVALLDGDAAAAERTRLLRLPGTRNEKNDGLVRLVEVTGEVFTLDDLDGLGEEPDAPMASVPEHAEIEPFDGPVFLPSDLWAYLRERPSRDDYDGLHASRSEAEAALSYFLAKVGLSDEEIIDRALRGWPKAREEARRLPHRPERWMQHTLSSARRRLMGERWQTFPQGGKPVYLGKRDDELRGALSRVPLVPAGEDRTAYRRRLEAALGVQKRKANRLIGRLCRDGFVDEIDGLLIPRVRSD